MDNSKYGENHVIKFMKEVSDISAFYRSNADADYKRAIQERKSLDIRLLLMVVIFFILLLTAFYLLIKGIRVPVKELTRANQLFNEGDMNIRSSYISNNEFGKLSASFNQLAETIQSQIALDQKENDFYTTLFERGDLNVFSQALLKDLLDFSGSQMAAIYLLNNEKSEFRLLESIGLSTGGRTSFSAQLKEGEFGKAMVSQQITHLQDIPPDSAFTFATVSGDFKPREIISIPIVSDNKTVAVISLASLHPYSSSTIRFLNDVFVPLTARLIGVLLFHEIKEQSVELDAQNRELEMQQNELSAQANELTHQNTELQMQKNQLNQSNRLKSTFLSNMSHELRTPLNSVIALSGVLRRRLEKKIPEEEYGYIDVIERNGKHLLELINDVLDLSRIEAGREEIEEIKIDIKALISEMVSLIEPQSKEKNVSLKSLLKGDLPPLISDEGKCRHILQNLIGNAVKFTEKGKVEIRASQKDNFIRISVSDTGIGIGKEQLPYIFDEFRQVDGSTSRKHEGAGLGLSIAVKYAKMLGGNIEVESTQDKGSVFTLVLPLKPSGSSFVDGTANDTESDNQNEYLFSEGVSRPQEKTILVVEDSDPAIIQIKDILEEEGFNVLVAHNGSEALEKIAETLPDAMILDLMMPEVDGFEVLKTIRANVETSHLPVLILTAKHITKEELNFLKNNHIFQLVQKGDVGRQKLLQDVNAMVFPTVTGFVKTPVVMATAIKTSSGKKPLLLVVEDNADNLFTMKALLENDYRVKEAYDGKEGVAKAIKLKPDLILMDISLPVMNGYEAFDAIRKEESLQKIPVVAVTASATTEDRDKILKYGFNAYISKPIDIYEFENTIKEWLKNK